MSTADRWAIEIMSRFLELSYVALVLRGLQQEAYLNTCCFDLLYTGAAVDSAKDLNFDKLEGTPELYTAFLLAAKYLRQDMNIVRHTMLCSGLVR